MAQLGKSQHKPGEGASILAACRAARPGRLGSYGLYKPGKESYLSPRGRKDVTGGYPSCLHHQVDEVGLQEGRGGAQLLLLNRFLLFLSRHLGPCPLQHGLSLSSIINSRIRMEFTWQRSINSPVLEKKVSRVCHRNQGARRQNQ